MDRSGPLLLAALVLFVALVCVPAAPAIAAPSATSTQGVDALRLYQEVGRVDGELAVERSERSRLASDMGSLASRVYAVEHSGDLKWTDVVTAIVAVLALGLSLYTLRRQAPRVVLWFDSPFYADSTDIPSLITLRVANAGGGRVVLSAWGLRLPGTDEVYVGQPDDASEQLPRALQTGDRFSTGIAVRMLAGRLSRDGLTGRVRLKAFVRDQTGRTYSLSPQRLLGVLPQRAYLDVDVEKWEAAELPAVEPTGVLGDMRAEDLWFDDSEG